MTFRLLAACPQTGARAGTFMTAHGELPTPAFMPVGTQATVKALTPGDLERVGARCVLANVYHLVVRPGADLVAHLGGLHRFMGWERPILTDSGGFQIYSLSARRSATERGVRFHSHLDDRTVELTPESVVETQDLLGSDIAMPLDVCPGHQATTEEALAAVERTRRWAIRSLQAHRRSSQALFGIVQGGMDAALRRQTARDLRGLNFPGFALGGLSVGEPIEVTDALVSVTAAELPKDRPRYLMGVGTPEQVARYVGNGIDLFDCVLPTRLGRTGVAFAGFERLALKKRRYARDQSPIEAGCDCPTCRDYSRAQLHEALRAGRHLGARLLSLHNTRALIRTAERARRAVLEGRFPALLAELHRTLAARGDGEAGLPSDTSPDAVVAR